MSTTFGVIDNYKGGEIEPIARRIGIGGGKVRVWFTNTIAAMLPDDTDVIPMDNSAQGIFTIGDLKEKVKEYKGDN